MKNITNIPRSLLAVFISTVVTTYVHGDPFVGDFTGIAIFDGDVEALYKDGFEPMRDTSVNISKVGSDRYTVELKAGSNTATIPTKRKGNSLGNFPRPTNMGGWKLHDFIMVSDGVTRGFFMIGQDEPNDINCAMGLWTEFKGKVTVNDFVGTWKIESYGDTNLLGTKDGFEHQVTTAEIRKIDSKHIQVITPGGAPLSLRVSGNEAALESPPVNTATARYSTFRMITDGQKMVFDVVASELDDPTDVSATIGLGVKTSAEISVQQPAGTQLVDGTAKTSFGTMQVGKSSMAKTFTIKNTGTSNLTSLAIKKSGSNSKDFIVSALAKKSLAPGTSTTFKVAFKPSAQGIRKATIRIRSNDADENPFDIQLSGMGVNTSDQQWAPESIAGSVLTYSYPGGWWRVTFEAGGKGTNKPSDEAAEKMLYTYSASGNTSKIIVTGEGWKEVADMTYQSATQGTFVVRYYEGGSLEENGTGSFVVTGNSIAMKLDL